MGQPVPTPGVISAITAALAYVADACAVNIASLSLSNCQPGTLYITPGTGGFYGTKKFFSIPLTRGKTSYLFLSTCHKHLYTLLSLAKAYPFGQVGEHLQQYISY